MICPDCGNLIAYNSYFDAFYCPRCGGIFKKVKPMTNADRIRAMSDKELKDWYCKNRDCGDCDFCRPFGCTFKDWLQQPYREENKHEP